jgi:hypothetical protein
MQGQGGWLLRRVVDPKDMQTAMPAGEPVCPARGPGVMMGSTGTTQL